MKRRTFITQTIAAGAIGTVLSGTAKAALQQPTNKEKIENIIHSVYFWLKDGLTKQEETEFLKYFEVLAKIPEVRNIQYGKPAPTTPRDVVDHSYSYNLIINFESLKDITTYETHPIHTAGAKEFSKFWKRVEVRDTILL